MKAERERRALERRTTGRGSSGVGVEADHGEGKGEFDDLISALKTGQWHFPPVLLTPVPHLPISFFPMPPPFLSPLMSPSSSPPLTPLFLSPLHLSPSVLFCLLFSIFLTFCLLFSFLDVAVISIYHTVISGAVPSPPETLISQKVSSYSFRWCIWWWHHETE